MPRNALTLAAVLVLALPAGLAHAQKNTQATAKPAADALIASQLKTLGYEHEIDEDGDYKLVFDVDGENKRSQLVFVRSVVETYGEFKVREIWSPGYAGTGDQIPAAVANRLLQASMDNKLGSWGKQGPNAIFIVRIPADADKDMLDTALTAAVQSADQMEAELTPGKDEL
jgi:hypothetical protein